MATGPHGSVLLLIHDRDDVRGHYNEALGLRDMIATVGPLLVQILVILKSYILLKKVLLLLVYCEL